MSKGFAFMWSPNTPVNFDFSCFVFFNQKYMFVQKQTMPEHK